MSRLSDIYESNTVQDYILPIGKGILGGAGAASLVAIFAAAAGSDFLRQTLPNFLEDVGGDDAKVVGMLAVGFLTSCATIAGVFSCLRYPAASFTYNGTLETPMTGQSRLALGSTYATFFLTVVACTISMSHTENPSETAPVRSACHGAKLVQNENGTVTLNLPAGCTLAP